MVAAPAVKAAPKTRGRKKAAPVDAMVAAPAVKAAPKTRGRKKAEPAASEN
jgi:hypothetical protein